MNTAERVRAYVAFGANLGDPVAAYDFARKRLAQLPATTVLASSALYRSAPIGTNAQPDYLNAVIALDTALTPQALLAALLRIETEGGRVRAYERAPRTLDLDLLLHGDAIVAEADLQLPHPRMHERAFVLLPLTEIAPEAHIPGHGSAAALLADLSGQRVERLPPPA